MTRRVTPGANFDVVNVKGFGDLVIALTCLRRVAPARRGQVRLLVAPHLEPLRAVLDPPFASAVLPRREQGPAALFRARTATLGQVTRSALDLRRVLRELHDPKSVLLFDEWDIRHRFLSLGARARGLPPRDNLYRRWNDFLAEQSLADPLEDAMVVPAGRRLHIFPGAREADRRFSVPLLRDLAERAARAGLEPRIFTVAGEMTHLADAGLPLEEMPRDFAATAAAIGSADRVISADSMTAHLAEHLNKPMFVLSPTLKYYWLPLSSAISGRHALFADPWGGGVLSAFLRQGAS
jgi:hypothetical protein